MTSKVLLAVVFVALAALAAVSAPKPAQAQSGQAVLSEARSWLGTPYVWGGESRWGVDCSGLIQAVYRNVGIDLPRTSQAQFYSGAPSYYAGAGDLVFSNYGYGFASHVGISNGNGYVINAPYPGTVVRYDPIGWGYVNGIKSIV